MKAIASAFIKAKKQFAPAMKTSTNPHFKSKYADLAACVEAVDDAFLDNGIVMYQETFDCDSGVTVETVLLHESGEAIRCGRLHVPASKGDAQGYGSALTYARRYSLMAACGIAPDDDDGNAASKKRDIGPTVEQIQSAIDTLTTAAKHGTEAFQTAVASIPSAVKEKIDAQIKRSIAAIAKQHDVKEAA